MTQTTQELAQCLKLQDDQFLKALEIIRLLKNEVLRQNKEIKFLKDLNRIQTIQNPNLCRPCNSST